MAENLVYSINMTQHIYQAIVDAPDLSIGYKSKKNSITIAEHLNIHIFKGEMVCLLGPNGCGKSTLIRTLAGMQAPLQGTVLIEGVDIMNQNISELAKKMSVVLTDKVDIANMTVYDIVSLGRFPYTNWLGKIEEYDDTIIHASIEKVGLAGFADRALDTLSDGERQRVMIARALAQETPFIMLDEPTAHLDLPNRIEIMKLLKELARSTYTSILLSTHELDLALQVADRIWLMQRNKPMACGTPEDLVLQGDFEQAFKKQSFDFDITNGLFKIVYTYKHKVSMSGNKIYRFWTERALHRHGFEICEQQEQIAHIEIHNKEWKLHTQQTTSICKSIFELLIALNSTNNKTL